MEEEGLENNGMRNCKKKIIVNDSEYKEVVKTRFIDLD